ncbi:histidine kinase [Lacinutrix neustonica]|uniref:Histidine kinase n=1 Tax=Lacinutrix neustonica TaxID=2980107 RepID=A0A9E8MVN2_9FLAO|nr:histidine kinase [Lacinutrix neustonica]WAC01795.1 histidine kinase [Lacinutrix neustonica]
MNFFNDNFYTLFYGCTLGSIFILSLITFFIYLKIKERSFLFYSLYAFCLNIYIGIRALDVISHSASSTVMEINLYVNWPLQFVYYTLYLLFIRSFFNFKITQPKVDTLIIKFLWILGLACFGFTLINVFFLSNTNTDLPYYFSEFIIYFYIPTFLPFVVYIIYKILQTKNPAKYYIILGGTSYVVSALVSMYFSVNDGFDFPIFFFMIGVQVEFLFFIIALGIKVYGIFKEKNKFQKQLITQLKENKKLIEYNNEILLERIELFAEKEIELELKHSISVLKSKVFRSQAHSHFIFNILNSIKGTIINDEKEKSIEQINNFSKLIRSILNHSWEEEISLEKEIEITQLYFALENQRFNNQIKFSVTLHNRINSPELIMVPPFIIQPFIENAIWHGLANKEEDRKLNLSIEKQDKYLLIKVRDNGIGILKSLEIKRKKSINHKSMGIDITRERLKLFAQKCNENYDLFLENIGDEQNSKGTQVTIQIPYKTV